MAPTCTNCGSTEFVWANEVKTGAPGAGLSLRARGEVPIGTRICRGCGHADLFLRDLQLLHRPHLWRPGEFVPIQGKPSAPPPPQPAPEPLASAPAPPAPEPSVSMPAPEPVLAVAPAPAESKVDEVVEPSAPAKPARRRSAKAKAQAA